MGPDIVVFGAINMDLTVEIDRLPRPGETREGSRFFTSGGGKGANQAVAAARLAGGHRAVRIVGRVGDDLYGEQLLAAFDDCGVDRTRVRVDPHDATGVAIILIDATGENFVLPVYGANLQSDADQLGDLEELIDEAAALLVQQELPLEVTHRAMRIARRHGVHVVLDPAPARNPVPAGFHADCDLLTPNQLEAEALSGTEVVDAQSAARAAESIRRQGVSGVVVTLAAQGAYLSAGGVPTYLPAVPVNPVATVAAGDAFNGTLAVALAERQPLQQAVAFANAAAALSVTRPGAQESMPHRVELDSVLQSARRGVQSSQT